MRISDWSSDVCSSDLSGLLYGDRFGGFRNTIPNPDNISSTDGIPALSVVDDYRFAVFTEGGLPYFDSGAAGLLVARSEEHTSELQSLMRISYAVFCLKKKNKTHTTNRVTIITTAL